jgi:TnpA family transposase
VQLTSLRYLGTFLTDPLDVPFVVVDELAGQLGIGDPSCLKTYGRREKTRLEHQWEITRREGWRDFTAAEADLRSWLADLAWTTGDGPRALFAGAMAWLRQRQVLLLHRAVYAPESTKWTDPRSRLLAGPTWEAAKGPALHALQLPEDPAGLLAACSDDLDTAWRQVASRIEGDGPVRLDEQARLHAEAIEAIPEPESLIALRARLQAMLPVVDLPELILEVMSWDPRLREAWRPVSGGEAQMADLPVSVTAALTAQALNVGYGPVVSDGNPALTGSRISHVDQNYLHADVYAAFNAVLLELQTSITVAQTWGGGYVAAVDGMRFVVPVRTVHARPNRRYFGRQRGVTLLGVINDQAMGTAGRVLSGTPRDSLHLIDLIYSQDGGQRPEVIVTDTGSYSDQVWGLLALLDIDYRPQLADLPDRKLWRIDAAADYGPLNATARGRIDLARIRRHWPDMLRVAVSVHTGAVAAYDVMRVLQHSGAPTPLGEAIATYGRIFKTLHVLTFVDDEPYRRQIKGMRNLSEARQGLARHVFHGHTGELRQGYLAGMEDQLGALGLVVNCITLWNTVYLDLALDTLREQGYPVLEVDVARIWPYLYAHINVHGHYSFQPPQLAGQRRALREPSE